jgi:hypothetical protein
LHKGQFVKLNWIFHHAAAAAHVSPAQKMLLCASLNVKFCIMPVSTCAELQHTHMLTPLLLLLLLCRTCSIFSIIAANSSSPAALQAAAAGSQGVTACLPPGLVQQLFGGLLQLLPDLAAGVLQQLALQLLLRLAETGEVTCAAHCGKLILALCLPSFPQHSAAARSHSRSNQH